MAHCSSCGLTAGFISSDSSDYSMRKEILRANNILTPIKRPRFMRGCGYARLYHVHAYAHDKHKYYCDSPASSWVLRNVMILRTFLWDKYRQFTRPPSFPRENVASRGFVVSDFRKMSACACRSR